MLTAVDTARSLLGRGADPLVENAREHTPLSVAEARSTEEIAALVRAAAFGP